MENTPHVKTLAEVLSESLPEATHEQVYRRAYRYGWIEALNAIGHLMFEQGKSSDTAHALCWEHWEGALAQWQDRADDPQAERELPPGLSAKRRKQ